MSDSGLPDDVDLENEHRAAHGRPPMSDKEIKAAGISAGALLLTEVKDFIGKYCVLPDENSLAAITLWAAHCHAIRKFHTTPRLAAISTEPESGKTRLLEVLHLLVPDGDLVLNPSSASVFRKLAQKQITVLLDECDAIFKVRGKEDPREDLRAMLNSGYRVGATIPRCVGPKHEVVDFPVFAACALAGIGDLPDTIMSRSIIIRMRRRAPHEDVEEFRLRRVEPVGTKIRERLAQWVALADDLGGAWPVMPEGVRDRKAECWEPLLAIADAAGGTWPQVARNACTLLCKAATDRKVSLGIRLLSDLRVVFSDSTAMHTNTILARLCSGTDYGLDADAPWPEIHGRPLGERGLASMLKRYGIAPIKVKINGVSLQGYRREHLWDAWQRYLPATHEEAEPPEPAEPGCVAGHLAELHRVPEVPQVPDSKIRESAGNGAAHCAQCAHFVRGKDHETGLCAHFNVETWPAPNPGCTGYQARAGEGGVCV